LVVKVAHDKLFEAENANGVSSTAMQVETDITAFALEKAPKIIDVECNTLANDEKLFGKFSGMTFVNCPAHCSKKPHTVFNNKDTYWFGSSICQSAMHNNLLTDQGGEVKFVYIKTPLKQYEGGDAGGIQSKAFTNA